MSLELVNKGTSQCFFNVVAMILNDFAMTGDIDGVEQKLQYFGTNLRTNILPRCLVTYAIRYAMENGKKKTEKNVVEFLSSIYKRSIVKEEHIENVKINTTLSVRLNTFTVFLFFREYCNWTNFLSIRPYPKEAFDE